MPKTWAKSMPCATRGGRGGRREGEGGDRLGVYINWEEKGRIEDKAPTDYTKPQKTIQTSKILDKSSN